MSGRSRAVNLVAAGAIALTGAVLAAPPAAADISASACPGPVTPSGNVVYVLPVGDVLTLAFPDGCEIGIAIGDNIDVLGEPPPALVVRFLAGASFIAIQTVDRNDDYRTTTNIALGCEYPELAEIIANVRENDGLLVGSCPGGTPAGLPPVMQQTTPLPDGSCVITDPVHNWAGVESGGWSLSWAEWANGGTGGTVCTRTLAYSDSTGRWAVAG